MRSAGKSGGKRQGQRQKRQVELRSGTVKIEALYVADAHKLVPKLYTFGYDFKNWNEYWAVLNTGEIYLGLPHGDSGDFNYEQERKEHPHRFLKYEADGRKISGLDYNGHEVCFELRQESFRVDDSTVFKRVDPCDGCRLSGVHRHEAYTTIVEWATSGGLPGQTTLSFHTDGSFLAQGCNNELCLLPRPHAKELQRKLGRDPETRMRRPNVASNDDIDEIEYSEVGGSGQYVIFGNTIELKYNDGRTEEAFFFKYPGDENHILSINGTNYFKQEEKGQPF